MISVLVASLDGHLFETLVPQIFNSGIPEALEIVVSSPERPTEREGVVWAGEANLPGAGPAFRRAFFNSRGEVCVVMVEDVTLDRGWLKEPLDRLSETDGIVGIGFDGGKQFECFGCYYANIPLFRRATAIELFDYFMPYQQHGIEISFSLGAWKTKKTVIKSRTNPVHFIGRPHNRESPSKLSEYVRQMDTRALLQQHREMADAWMVNNWTVFNHQTA